jgi:hypothetical protein
MDFAMGQPWRLGCVIAFVLSCAPEFPHARIMGPGRFDVHCPNGLRQCGYMAGQLCLHGYQVEGTKNTTTGSSVVIACSQPPAPEPVAVAPESPEPEAKPEPPKPQCSQDYHSHSCALAVRERCLRRGPHGLVRRRSRSVHGGSARIG